MTSSTELAALLCSRLCHDLLSPVGAIGNGLEMLAEETDPELRRSYFDLLEQSARASTTKLKFYRFAYGSPGGFGERVPSEEPRALLEGLLAGNAQIELEWMVEATELDRSAMKILLNFAAVGAAALVRGGSLVVGAEVRAHETEIVVRAQGPRIAFDPAIGSTLEGAEGDRELSSHAAPALLVRTLAEEAGGEIQHAVMAEMLLLGARLPTPVAAS